MVLEVALIEVLPGREDDFAAAYVQARPLLAGTPGCRSIRMTRGIESPSRFVLLVEWDSVQAHEQNFRATDRFPRWRALIGPYFAAPPVVEHFSDVHVDHDNPERSDDPPIVVPPGRFAAEPQHHLQRVLTSASPLIEADGTTILVTSVELWSESVHIFFAGVPTERTRQLEEAFEQDLNESSRRRREGETTRPPASPGTRMLEVSMTLADDIGTEYRDHGGSAGGSGTEWRMHRSYQPGVPPAASRLELVVTGADGQVAGRLELM